MCSRIKQASRVMKASNADAADAAEFSAAPRSIARGRRPRASDCA
jgi:hypothetical protein